MEPTQCLFPNIRETCFDRSTWLDDMEANGSDTYARISSSGDQRPSGRGASLTLVHKPSQGLHDENRAVNQIPFSSHITSFLHPSLHKVLTTFSQSSWSYLLCADSGKTSNRQLLRAGPMKLDLRSLSRSDGPPSELQARREKYAFFEKQCSEVADGLFLGSDVVARNREVLRAAGITHVINCVGFLYPAYFQDELTYLVLYLQGELFSETNHSLNFYTSVLLHSVSCDAVTALRICEVAACVWTSAACKEYLQVQVLRAQLCVCRHSLGGHSIGAV